MGHNRLFHLGNMTDDMTTTEIPMSTLQREEPSLPAADSLSYATQGLFDYPALASTTNNSLSHLSTLSDMLKRKVKLETERATEIESVVHEFCCDIGIQFQPCLKEVLEVFKSYLLSGSEQSELFNKNINDDVIEKLCSVYESNRAKLRRVQNEQDVLLHNLVAFQIQYIQACEMLSKTTISILQREKTQPIKSSMWENASAIFTTLATMTTVIDVDEKVVQMSPTTDETAHLRIIAAESFEAFQTAVRKGAIDHQLALTRLQEIQSTVSRSLIDIMKQYLVAESGYLAARQFEAQTLFKHLETLNVTSDIAGTIGSLKPQTAREDDSQIVWSEIFPFLTNPSNLARPPQEDENGKLLKSQISNVAFKRAVSVRVLSRRSFEVSQRMNDSIHRVIPIRELYSELYSMRDDLLTGLYSDDTESPVRTLKSYKAEESIFPSRSYATSLTTNDTSSDQDLSSPMKADDNIVFQECIDCEQVVQLHHPQQHQQQAKNDCYSLVPCSENEHYRAGDDTIIFDDENHTSRTAGGTSNTKNLIDALLRFGLIANNKC